MISPAATLPSWYHSPMSTADKLDVAGQAMAVTTERGLTPVAASVTGSRLRGVDTADSDVDVLVLVAEKLPRAKTWRFSDEVEGQVQSLYCYADLLTRSVPYLEFQRSPFLVADPAYAPFLASLQVNPYEWNRHATGFVRHLVGRRGVAADKRLRTAACVWWMVTTGNPLCPRELVHRETVPDEALAWLAEATDHEQVRDADRAAVLGF